MTDGYPVCRLGAVASVQGGFAFKSGDFTETGVPVLKIKNVRLREVDTTEPAYVDQSVAKDTARYFCKTGDLLISMTGSGPQAPNSVVGRVARFTGPSDRYLINQRVGRFMNKAPEKLDQRYLFYVLAQEETLWKLVSVATGSANQANISGSQIESLELPLPPLAEQKAIAAVLGALDDKIELNRRMNATLEAMARALFQSWFVDFDPVRAKLDGRQPVGMDEATAALFSDQFEQNPEGAVPKGWAHKRWGDIATLEYGKSIRDYRESTGRYRVFGTNGPIGFHDASLCDGPGIVIGRKGAYRGVHYSPEPFFAIDTAFYLKPTEPLDLKWAYYELLRFDINNMDSGSAIPSTSRDDFYGIPVVLPPAAIQDRFGKIVDDWFAKVFANNHQSRTLATLRDTLLPKLLSGELSVRNAERLIVAET